ncbi:hypothetical protein Tsubulata_046062 [Turnera subulata]|uniref:Telomere repeat-binding protein 3 n=1 Tax=Turnera subulata TaxID=218843 RepID=A0A9Q0J9C1_9ROSI|nr:hypothetical protein Tsubulata_046062 [Turnera subulata]
MVLKKRQYYGFTDFHVPSVPRGPRSARGRGPHKKKASDDQICAFELLASLAGKLLQESESSASSNASEANDQPAFSDSLIKHEEGEELPLKTGYHDQGSYEESAFIPEFDSVSRDQKCILQELPQVESDSILERSSIITNSDSSEKVSSDLKSVVCKSKTTCENFSSKLQRSPDSGESSGCYVENRYNRQQADDKLDAVGLTVNNTSNSEVLNNLRMKHHALGNSDNDVKLPSCRSAVHNASILGHRNFIKLGLRDDDENFSRFTKSNIKPKAFRLPSRIGDWRIRKLLTSKYWKASPKLKDFELSRGDGGMKPLCHKRKMYYGRERYQHDTLHKRRKFSARSLVVTNDGGFSCESACNSPEKSMDAEKNGSATVFHGVNEMSSSVIGHHTPFRSTDCHVKFSIKSIRVPELFIEVPETATVGSLKRTVMDAVTAILGGGLRVGVVLHGKKVRDDNRTLLQTGIASEENLDTLGFTLEPNPMQASPFSCTEDASVLKCDTPKLVSRSPATPVLDSGISEALPEPSFSTRLGNHIESNNDSNFTHTDIVTDEAHADSKALVAIPPYSSCTDIVTDNAHPDSKALVAIPPANAEALAAVPINQKTKRPEPVQRRTRRPFSVTEVEALVQAVEELGTGRWRDVKLRSFENADHRTYVDLKDKWKTLVHTAKIAPQQRRGEPVPQELLDRVLAAHAYWSQHQVKPHSKNQTATSKIAEVHAPRNGIEGIHSI